MRVGISVHFQHSFFSNGNPIVALSLAEALSKLGHEVILVNINENEEWYEDLLELKDVYQRMGISKISDAYLDTFIDIDGFLAPSHRRRIAKHVTVFLRKPMFLTTFEYTVYPTGMPSQNFDCDSVWTWDHFGKQDTHLIEILTKKPVMRIPYTWTSKALVEYGKNIPKWNSEPKDGLWNVHIIETNMSVSSSCTLPLVGAAYAKTHSKLKFNEVHIHNADRVEKHQFFIDNVLNHSKRQELDIKFFGRVRTADFCNIPKSILITHMRFLSNISVLLDCIWCGIPFIHNSPFIKSLGNGLERYYYDDNSVVGMTNALNAIEEDFTNTSGMFTPGFLETIRQLLTKTMDPIQHSTTWNRALKCTPLKRELVVGFTNFYQEFNPSYNFWTLLLNEAGRHLNPPVSVRGVSGTENIDLLIFGTFHEGKVGNTGGLWSHIKVPKFHVTGENTNLILDVFNFGFKPSGHNSYRFPLWMQYIDWFGANQEKLVNPKTMPIDSVCKVSEDVLKSKKKFCSFIVTNPTNELRNQAFHIISNYKQVDSAGRLYNNVGDSIFTELGGGGGGELKKLEFLKDYKFSITYENSRSPGYVTEKLLAAKAAGCVPIYWGALDVEQDFPKESFLNVNTITDGNMLIEAVRKMDMDDSAWMAMAKTPAVDATKVRTMLSDVARHIFSSVLELSQLVALPPLLGASTTAEAIALGMARGDLTTQQQPQPQEKAPSAIIPELNPIQAKLEKPMKNHEWNQKTVLVTCATAKYIEPLLKWLMTVTPRLNDTISARVYLGSDVDTMNYNLLLSQYPNIEFYKLPVSTIKVPMFPDIWEPQHFAWKLWIYQELVQEQSLQNSLVWYMDCASMIVRWPTEWFSIATKTGICMLEDEEQKNDQWCQPSFCKRLMVTPEELSQQQVVGGIMAFIAGASLPWKVFNEAWVLGQQRDIIVGPKWSGKLPDGRPFGHRHDQSILSLLRIRRQVPTYPLYSVYCHESLRRTYKSGAALYIHRGNFKEHENFAPRIGEVHIINLARRRDRVERFKKNHPWSKQVCLRPAYEGKDITLSPALAQLFAPNDFMWKKAIMGCALSHLSLWNELAMEPEVCENYLILEDDVKFQSDWLSIWAEASKHIPEDYDVLYLGGVLPPNKPVYAGAVETVNSFWGRIRPNQIFGQREPTRYFHFCNYSYILSRKGAKKIMELLSTNGYTTSADHMVCNRMDMNHYVLTPLVAGCYQDDDPTYQQSQFNNFNRVDSFDSDLWNNDERFTEQEIQTNLSVKTTVTIQQALADGRVTSTSTPSIAVKSASNVYTVGDFNLVKGSLFEYDWLEKLIGPLNNQKPLPIDHEPLDNCPIFVVEVTHLNNYLYVFNRYTAANKPFYVVHISDEHGKDPIDWYAACKHVVRMYPRKDTEVYSNVTTIPLGPSRMTLEQHHLPQRRIIWSFYGTGWLQREEKLSCFKPIQPNAYAFYGRWADPAQLSAAEFTEKCLNSIFMLCPGGNNPETFRFYEALEHGCIPLYVREPNDEGFFQMISSNLPMIALNTWEEARGFMITLLQKQEMLADYRLKLLTAWVVWKKKLEDTKKLFVQ